MVSTHGIASAATYYENTIKQKKDSTVKTQNSEALGQAVKSSEEKLSTKAKNYLDSLRKTYGDYNFIIADEGDDRRALLDKSDKEFSIIFSSAELEKMASDEKYASEKMRRVETVIEMSGRICEQFGFGQAGENGSGSDTLISKLAVSLNDDGSMTIFAELEKMSERQKDYIEKLREKRATEKEAAEKSEEKTAKPHKKDEDSVVKKVFLEASSEEELIEKIGNVDWNKVSGVNVGARFDFMV